MNKELDPLQYRTLHLHTHIHIHVYLDNYSIKGAAQTNIDHNGTGIDKRVFLFFFVFFLCMQQPLYPRDVPPTNQRAGIPLQSPSTANRMQATRHHHDQ